MSLSLEQLAEQALQLPPDSRALLADRLVESLELSQPEEIQRLWSSEAIRRRDEIRKGQVKPVDGQQALADVRRIIGR